VVEIDTELTLTVTGHFMATGWRNAQNLPQMVRSLKFHKALLELLRPDRSEGSLHLPGGIADFLEFLGAEENEHGEEN
jgi:hypothetical protein